ncbi:hypothetical protein [Arenibacter echinorum]|uniref:Uncharacterized protein n=1 Tax=Arenibacter echinorum TaxID=440515 RepID=A0A327QXA7_9FLAO|nr:hypothetical protein [Arenibacter echinorum]RAJ08971.1 hypothetical protein LV92_03189 [Arenibacter echinorum]
MDKKIGLKGAIAIVTVGNVPFKQILDAQDHVFAKNAETSLGQIGFTTVQGKVEN